MGEHQLVPRRQPERKASQNSQLLPTDFPAVRAVRNPVLAPAWLAKRLLAQGAEQEVGAGSRNRTSRDNSQSKNTANTKNQSGGSRGGETVQSGRRRFRRSCDCQRGKIPDARRLSDP